MMVNEWVQTYYPMNDDDVIDLPRGMSTPTIEQIRIREEYAIEPRSHNVNSNRRKQVYQGRFSTLTEFEYISGSTYRFVETDPNHGKRITWINSKTRAIMLEEAN